MTPRRPQPPPKGAQFGHDPFPPREPAPRVKEHDQKEDPGKPWEPEEPEGHQKELSGSTQSTHSAPKAPLGPQRNHETTKGLPRDAQNDLPKERSTVLITSSCKKRRLGPQPKDNVATPRRSQGHDFHTLMYNFVFNHKR